MKARTMNDKVTQKLLQRATAATSKKSSDGINRPLAYKFVAAADDSDVTDLYIDGTIGLKFELDEDGWYTLNDENTGRKFRDKLADVTTSKIRVWINSYGGDTNEGIMIYDQLKNHAAQVETILQGMCASAATMIAAAGDIRTISSTAVMLIHHCMAFCYGWYNSVELQAMAEDNKAIDAVMFAMYQNEKISDDDLQALFDANGGYGKWISADDAIEFGLADQIRVPGEDETEEADDEAVAAASQRASKKMHEVMNTPGVPPLDKQTDVVALKAAAIKLELNILNI